MSDLDDAGSASDLASASVAPDAPASGRAPGAGAAAGAAHDSGPVISAEHYRTTLGHFCTGITIVTAAGDGGPAGFTCQSFSALSLDPPLVLVCPGMGSTSWPRIESTGAFCVNVLAEDQEE
ncbi:MAG: flavin reductase family protein, partial [Acidimicrobiales bacterium]